MIWPRILLFLLLCALLDVDYTNGKFRSRGGSYSSRGSHSSSRGTSHSTSHTPSRSTSHSTSHSTSNQHSPNQGSSQASSTTHRRPGSTEHNGNRQNDKQSSTSLIHSEGGGATKPHQNHPVIPPTYNPSAPPLIQNTRPLTSYPPTPGQNHPAIPPHNPSAPPYNPSAPPLVHDTRPLSSYPPNHGQNHPAIPPHNPSAPPYNPSAPPLVHDTRPLSSYPPNHGTPSTGPLGTIFNQGIQTPPQQHPIGFNTFPSNTPPPPGFKPDVLSSNNHRNPVYPAHPMPLPNQPISYPNQNSHVNYPTFSTPNHYPSQPNGLHYPGSTINHPINNQFGGHTPNGYNVQSGPTFYPQQQHFAQPAAQPYVPGQTVLVVPNQQSNGRGLGDMIKEALVFSTINAGVNRLINPHHHYTESRPVTTADGTTNDKTSIVYNNHYYNNYPGNGTPGTAGVQNPGLPPNQASNPTGPYTSPNLATTMNNPGPNNTPVGVSSIPSSNTLTNTRNDTNANIQGNDPNKQTNATNNAPEVFQYPISDNDLYKISEELFAQEEHNVTKYITLNLQTRFAPYNFTGNITDVATGPLFYVQPEAYDIPSIKVIRMLYDNYERNSSKKENRTLEKRREENLFLDTILNTNVVNKAMRWLANNNFIDPDDFERKDILRHIWFSQFSGTSSGFERVFMSEIYGGTNLLGIQDWIYFDYEESFKRINYMGYVDKLNLGNKASLLKLNFEVEGIIRPNATIFLGTTPELEMSLYTICFYARPNNLCPVSLGNTTFNIYTHAFRYFGKDLIDLALPII